MTPAEVNMSDLAGRLAAMSDVERVECLLRNYQHVSVHLGIQAVAALVLEAEELGVEVPKCVNALLRRKQKIKVRTNPLPEGVEIDCWLPACPPWLMQPSTPEQPKGEPEVTKRLSLAQRMNKAGRRLRR